MTFESRTAELNADGWIVNNCFQLNGRWRVNLRHEDRNGYSAFGDGADPLDALEHAAKTIDFDAEPISTDDVEALLG